MFKIIEKGPYVCGETPLWDEISNSIYWVDAAAHKIFCHKIDSREMIEYTPQLPVTAIRKADSGNFYLLTKWGLYLWSTAGSEDGTLLGGRDFLDLSDSVRFNDGVPLADGSFIAGSFDEADLDNDRGAFYRMNIKGDLEILDTGLHVTNGIAAGIDEKYYYLSEMYRKRVVRYEIGAEGTVLEKKIHIEFTDHEGKPDGLLCGKDGNLWVAHWLGWKISCWSKDGKRIKEIESPVASPTCICFGDNNESSLYITSAALELTDDDFSNGPDAGALFRLKL